MGIISILSWEFARGRKPLHFTVLTGFLCQVLPYFSEWNQIVQYF